MGRVSRGRQRRLEPGGSSAQPGVVAASGNVQHAEQQGHRVHGLVRPHESEGFGSVIDSRANQAAVVPRISRSSLSCWVCQIFCVNGR